MTEQTQEEKTADPTDDSTVEIRKSKRATRWAYLLGILGIVLTLIMAFGIVFYRDEVENLKHYGYLGAFFISIPAFATDDSHRGDSRCLHGDHVIFHGDVYPGLLAYRFFQPHARSPANH